MLDPCEVAHCEGNLTVDSAYDTSEHCGAYCRHISSLASRAEGLVIEDDNVQEENDEGGVETISHPPKYPIPVEEQVSGSLLIQCWKLQKGIASVKIVTKV